MKICMASQMRSFDKAAHEKYGIPSILLMENAASALAFECEKETGKNENILIVCGTGNNGGDGFAAARLLSAKGFLVSIFISGSKEKLSGDALVNFKAAGAFNIPIVSDFLLLPGLLNEASVIIDALIGTGFKGELKKNISEIVDLLNKSGKKIISADIPTGVDSDTGWVSEKTVKAYKTVTFGLMKTGLLLYPAAEYCGEIVVAPISIPKEVFENSDIDIFAITPELAKNMLPKRKPRSHKGDYGKIFIAAGSKNMTGAAALSALSAYKSGGGVVYACVVESIIKVIQNLVPEAVIIPLPEENGALCKGSLDTLILESENGGVIISGPGIGRSKGAKEFITKLVEKSKKPLIIDADGIMALSGQPELLKKAKSSIVITPHMKEMSALTGIGVDELTRNPLKAARETAEKYNVTVLLKDARTIIASPDKKTFINLTGNPAMAKGGSGDVLTGVIAAFIGAGLSPFDSTCLGAYIHGLAGDIAAEKIGGYGVLARDIARHIPEEIDQILKTAK
ncbi:MAG: NAD(P)H-hydrate dehydratase [Lachnospiraceae bacterium]|nr:NAD(P)H-hydrate dehydratase [Lachnospiraceae bacterium]